MFTVRTSLLAPVLACTLLLAVCHIAKADTLADGYNALVFGDFTAQSSDVEGRVGVGGNMSVNYYSVGDKLTGAMVGGNTLVVGGNLNYQGGQVFHGNTVVGGTYTGPGYNLSVSPWTVSDSNSVAPGGFSASQSAALTALSTQQASLTSLSAQLAALDATGTSTLNGTVKLAGDGSSPIQVFNVDGSDVKSAWGIEYITGSAPTDATLIINISGTDPEVTDMAIMGLESVRENVIFNFYEATSLALGGVGMQGSILAPLATINSSWGVVWGQVVANNWNGPMQINQVYFGGELPDPPPVETGGGPDDPEPSNATPEPATAGMLALSMLGLSMVTRRGRR